jgi:hypothetical protein
MMGTVILATGACAAVWAGGYLLGARRGLQARGALRDQLAEAERHAAAATAQAAAMDRAGESAEALAAELDRRLAPLQAREDQMRRIAGQLEAAVARVGDRPQASDDLHRILAPVLAQADDTARLRDEIRRMNQPANHQADEARLRRIVAEAIRPITEHDRLGAALATVESGTDRADLNALLNAVARKAGFIAVLLSDASGLLLANSASAQDAELRAGVSSLLVTLADQFAKSGMPEPRAVLIHDAANQVAISRLFAVDDDRYLLTAVTAGQHVTPTALDPVLEKIEALMSDWTISPRRDNGRPLAHAG